MNQVIWEKPNAAKKRNKIIKHTGVAQTNSHRPSVFSHQEDSINIFLSPRYQVLLLNNGKSQDVRVQETDRIDFNQVEDHLKHGGSIFITSERSQKLTQPKETNLQPSKNNPEESNIWLLDYM
jgi:hypothetical protein